MLHNAITRILGFAGGTESGSPRQDFLYWQLKGLREVTSMPAIKTLCSSFTPRKSVRVLKGVTGQGP